MLHPGFGTFRPHDTEHEPHEDPTGCAMFVGLVLVMVFLLATCIAEGFRDRDLVLATAVSVVFVAACVGVSLVKSLRAHVEFAKACPSMESRSISLAPEFPQAAGRSREADPSISRPR
jgi:hypothetical protein